MRKKLYRNLTTLVLMFALAIGTFIGTTMDVLAAAQNFNVDITTSADEIQSAGENIIFGPGDSITYKSSEIGSNTIVIYLRNGSASINQHNYGSISYFDNCLVFPDKYTLGEKTYINPEWKLTSVKFLSTFPNYRVLYLYFNVCTEAEPDPNPEEKPDTTAVSKASTSNSYVPSHECNFQWVTTVEPQPGVDGLEEYKCVICGMVKESQPIPAGMATVKNLYGFIKDAPENGTVTTDFGKLHTISDYLLKKMAERSDATVTIQFEYKNQKLQITFPAGTDYTPVLTDTDTMYGFYGVAAKLGLTVTERQ